MTYDWLRIITGPFQKSDPLVVAAEYTGGGASANQDTSFDGTRATVHMIMRMKNVDFVKFKVEVYNKALDVGFFQDVGKYITHFNYHPHHDTFIGFNEVIKDCTSLVSLKLRLKAHGGGDTHEYILPDSVQTVKLESDRGCIHTIHGAQVTRLELSDCMRVRGTLPNLRVIRIGVLNGDAAKYLISFVKASRYLEKVSIDVVYPPAIAKIAGIVDHRFRIFMLECKPMSSVEAMAHVSTTMMNVINGEARICISPHEVGNTAL
ncbi:hypothetical protein TRVA0_007S01002 [Trichomonascus vanleenenianus]|uniref:uncharacterized protein n=1 Tax=Trichomonascus vanleenenianus TaxID=2268995 RepID=UPI003ECA1CF2